MNRAFKRKLELSKIDIKNFKIADAPSSAYYVSNFLQEKEEESVLSDIYAVPKPKWTQLSNRRLQNWGGVPHSKGMIAEAIPSWLETYLERIDYLNVMKGNRPNHVLVNEYLPGQGIMPHTDGSLFYPTITTISLGSHTVLKFYEPSTNPTSIKHVFSFLLEPRSLLVLQNDLYSRYLHAIDDATEDVLDDSVINLSTCADCYEKGSKLTRDRRVSLTIRHVPKATAYKINIDNGNHSKRNSSSINDTMSHSTHEEN